MREISAENCEREEMREGKKDRKKERQRESEREEERVEGGSAKTREGRARERKRAKS